MGCGDAQGPCLCSLLLQQLEIHCWGRGGPQNSCGEAGEPHVLWIPSGHWAARATRTLARDGAAGGLDGEQGFEPLDGKWGWGSEPEVSPGSFTSQLLSAFLSEIGVKGNSFPPGLAARETGDYSGFERAW